MTSEPPVNTKPVGDGDNVPPAFDTAIVEAKAKDEKHTRPQSARKVFGEVISAAPKVKFSWADWVPSRERGTSVTAIQ